MPALRAQVWVAFATAAAMLVEFSGVGAVLGGPAICAAALAAILLALHSVTGRPVALATSSARAVRGRVPRRDTIRVRLSDPDAAGRPRPRAPSHLLAR